MAHLGAGQHQLRKGGMALQHSDFAVPYAGAPPQIELPEPPHACMAALA